MGVLGDGDVEMITNLKKGGGFEGFLASFDFASLAGFGGQGASFVKSDCPEPFIETAVIRHEVLWAS